MKIACFAAVFCRFVSDAATVYELHRIVIMLLYPPTFFCCVLLLLIIDGFLPLFLAVIQFCSM